MRTLLFALVLVAPTALAQTEHIVYLHEDPLHALPEIIRADVGERLAITVENPAAEGKTPHNFLVCGDPKDPSEACSDRWGFTALIQPGEQALVTFVAKTAGTFEYYCYIAGHKAGGMRGELIVEGAANEKSAIPGAQLVAILAAFGAIALARRRRA